MTNYNNITLNGKKVADYIICEYDAASNISYFQYSLTKPLTALSCQSFFHLFVKLNDEMLRNSKVNHPILKDPALKNIFDRLNDTDERDGFEPTYFEMNKIADIYEGLTLPKVEGIKAYHSYLEPWIGGDVVTLNFEKALPNNSGWASVLYNNPALQEDPFAPLYNENELNNSFNAFQEYCDTHNAY